MGKGGSKESSNKKRANAVASAATAPSTAVATRFLTGDPTVNDGAGTADPGIHTECGNWAVANAGTTFHTAIQFNDPCQTIFYGKHRMGTDPGAEAATDTSVLIQFEGSNPF